ncbi:hypothetical protein EJ08DRAFT_693836 [Tothia fuscella]|uniref:Uncharacterized protein n=1 Tax=Tothia fuscella TaxID=1048955 RepID=A0A9P4NZV9_9PEZI|nr:hypothetical protein EJ08DRAFT_693836 [Tothia fuscella]
MSNSANSFLFLKPILTPNALATVQANPILLAYMGLAMFGISVVIFLATYTSWVTGKPYKKPKAKKGASAGPGKGANAMMGKVAGGFKGLRVEATGSTCWTLEGLRATHKHKLQWDGSSIPLRTKSYEEYSSVLY